MNNHNTSSFTSVYYPFNLGKLQICHVQLSPVSVNLHYNIQVSLTGICSMSDVNMTL